MAIVTTQQKSGSVGPSTFITHPRYGVIERVRAQPLNPRTPAQAEHRHIVSGVAGHWRTLSDPQREGWNALAVQAPGNLTGYGAFARVNINRLHCGLPLLEEAPPTPSFGTLRCAGLVVDDTPVLKLLQVSSTVAPDKFIIEASRPVSAGVRYVRKLFRRLKVVDGHAAPAADLDFTAAYLERFGAPRVGCRVVVRLTPLHNGFKGEPVQCSAIVAAHGG